MKTALNRLVSVILIALLAAALLAACSDAPEPRVTSNVTYSPGAAFSTNFNHEDPRRQVKCTIMFEVVDELAIEELDLYNYRIRNSVISVLSEFTMEELTIYRDLPLIAEKIVERVNADIGAVVHGEEFNLILKAYFTEFAVI